MDQNRMKNKKKKPKRRRHAIRKCEAEEEETSCWGARVDKVRV